MVSNPTEGIITINSKKYTLKSHLISRFLSPLPGKINTGPDEFDNQTNINTWTISDQRGGLGVSEMDESVHSDRYWWGNCITDHDKHLFLPRLATAITFPTFDVPSITNADMESNSDWTGGTQSGLQAHGGTKSWTVSAGNDFSYQDISFDSDWKNGRFTFSCWVWTDNAATGRLQLNDGVGTTSGSKHSGGSSWEQLSVTRQLDSSATKVRLLLDNDGGSDFLYFDDATIDVAPTTSTDVAVTANFNGELYIASAKNLLKLDSGRTTASLVNNFESNITDLIPTVNSSLLIYLGDTDNYWFMSTAEVFTDTDVNDANIGISWDAKAWKMTTTGGWSYAATPNSATPTWTAQTGVTDIASQIERLFIGKDANGDDVIYCATNSILKVFDFTNNKWLDTALKLPNHPTGGKGATYWHDGHYLSYGLGVKKYVTGTTATISETGLNRDDGLPVEYNGEIVKFLGEGASDNLFALVDSSVTSGNSKSGLYAYDGRSWKCWWIDTSNNGAMNDVIISSAQSGYAVYWDSGDTLYYIDLHRGLQNVDQLLGTQKFASSGLHISPWFDAGTQAFSKLLARVISFARKITTSESVVIKYRTDKINTDIDTGWTTLATLKRVLSSGLANYLIFDDTANSYIDAGVINNSQGKLWVSLWFKLDSPFSAGTDVQRIYGKFNSVADNIDLSLNIDGKLHFTKNGSLFDLTSTATSWNANQWYHVIASISSAAGARMIIDGGTAVTDADASAAPAGGKIIFGNTLGSGSFADNRFEGEIAEIVLGIDDLSGGEEAGLLAGTLPGDETEYWSVNEGTGTSISSSGSVGTTATAGSATVWSGDKNTSALLSGAGVKFNSYQLKLELARGSTNTLTPDLQAIVSAYELLTGGEGDWTWVFTVRLDKEHGTTPKQKQENIETALQLNTLVPLLFRSTTTARYVRLTLLSQTSQTGYGYEGEATIQAVEI